MDGASDGPDDGTMDVVGTGVGTEEGMKVGGFVDGTADGVRLGANDGSSVGKSDGLSEGLCDCDCDGSTSVRSGIVVCAVAESIVSIMTNTVSAVKAVPEDNAKGKLRRRRENRWEDCAAIAAPPPSELRDLRDRYCSGGGE